MLNAIKLSYYYQRRRHFYLPQERVNVFQNVSFSLPLGENLLIYGPSGSGKSTLGKILAGIQAPKEGFVLIDETRLLSLSPHQIQYLFQDQKTALNPYKKIRTLIMDVAKHFQIDVNLEELLESFELSPHILHLKPCDLSTGEAQRVGILRALIPRPKILICDEITASLDPCLRKRVLEILKQYQQNNPISLIFISHLKEEFERVCSSCLHLMGNQNTQITTIATHKAPTTSKI